MRPGVWIYLGVVLYALIVGATLTYVDEWETIGERAADE